MIARTVSIAAELAMYVLGLYSLTNRSDHSKCKVVNILLSLVLLRSTAKLVSNSCDMASVRARKCPVKTTKIQRSQEKDMTE